MLDVIALGLLGFFGVWLFILMALVLIGIYLDVRQ